MLATIAVVACGLLTRMSSGPGALSSSSVVQAGRLDPSVPSSRFRDPLPRIADLKAVETDTDDDDDKDPRWAAADDRGPGGRCLALPSHGEHGVDGELPHDPSRFAAGRGLPRGPPA